MTDSLHRLLEVQDQDTLGDQLRHRREHHPLRAELAEVDAGVQRAEHTRDEAVRERDEILRRQADLESEAQTTQLRLAALESRLYSAEVSAARDLQAMAAEADSLRSRVAGLEDDILLAMEEAEPVQAQVAEAETTLDRLRSRREELGRELAAAEAEIRAEESAHAATRAELARTVPEDLLARYERLRARLGGVAVAALTNGMCGGCHLRLPATELDRIRKAPPDAVLVCEQCGRILVRP